MPMYLTHRHLIHHEDTACSACDPWCADEVVYVECPCLWSTALVVHSEVPRCWATNGKPWPEQDHNLHDDIHEPDREMDSGHAISAFQCIPSRVRCSCCLWSGDHGTRTCQMSTSSMDPGHARRTQPPWIQDMPGGHIQHGSRTCQTDTATMDSGHARWPHPAWIQDMPDGHTEHGSRSCQS